MNRTIEEVKNLWMETEMPDGRLWAVPVLKIAENRAESYKEEFGNDAQRSLNEDTLPLFAEDDFEIQDWAVNNMNWSDLQDYAVEVVTHKSSSLNYEHGWLTGNKKFLINPNPPAPSELPVSDN